MCLNFAVFFFVIFEVQNGAHGRLLRWRYKINKVLH